MSLTGDAEERAVRSAALPGGETAVSSYNAAAGSVTILSEGFEGSWPGSKWLLGHDNAGGYERLWGPDNYRSHNGNYSAWPVHGGQDGGAASVYLTYPPNTYSYMVYGPFDLSDATAAEVKFWLWREIEAGTDKDYLFFGISHDLSEDFDGFFFGGAQDWTEYPYSLNAYTGDNSVYVAWIFYSNATNEFGGPFVDDILISKELPPPTADFSGTPTSGTKPLKVDFTNLSTGDINSYAWTFGDGGSSTQANPSHTYMSAGEYTVSLTVTGPGGSDTETKTNYIYVVDNPLDPLLYLPSMWGIDAQSGNLPGSGWTSGQQVQNTGTSDAKVTMTAVDLNGTTHNCDERTIAPGASSTWLTGSHCQVDAGLQVSGLVSSDQPIGAVVNVNNRGTGAAAGQYLGTSGADAAGSILFPLVKNNHSGRTTTFFVQNASTIINTLTATFRMRDGGEYNKTYTDVPANAMVVISPSDAGVPAAQGQVGSLTVVGTQSLAGSSLEHQHSAAVGENLQASKAFTAADGAQTVLCPLYRNAHTAKGQTTGAQVQNVTNASVTVEFTVKAGGNTYGPYSETIPAGESATFYAPNLTSPSIPAGTVGSAEIKATGNVVAVVNDKGTEGSTDRVTTYACFPGGTSTVNIPLYKEFRGGNTTGIQIQNAGTSATKVSLTYKSTDGKIVKIESSSAVAPGASITAWGVSNLNSNWQVVQGTSTSLNNTVGGVVIEAAGGSVVAIANEHSSAPNASGQDTKNYEGFNQ